MNIEDLLARCETLSSRQVEEVLINLDLKKREERRPSIRKTSEVKSGDTVAFPSPTTGGGAQPVGNYEEGRPAFSLAEVSLPNETSPNSRPSGVKAEPGANKNQGRYNIQFAVDADLKIKMERLAEVMGFQSATPNLEKIIALAIEDALDKRDPCRKAERLEKRARKAAEKSGPGAPCDQSVDAGLETGDSLAPIASDPANDRRNVGGSLESPAPEVKDARYIPADIRAKVLKRAAYCCEFVSKDGVRCSSRSDLEVDHIVAKALGGKAELFNLQTLCRAHNLRKAEIDMGEIFIRNKISAHSNFVAHSA